MLHVHGTIGIGADTIPVEIVSAVHFALFRHQVVTYRMLTSWQFCISWVRIGVLQKFCAALKMQDLLSAFLLGKYWLTSTQARVVRCYGACHMADKGR
jgi:hypothetical protein